MKRFFLKSVPFSQIRHNDVKCYLDEGFGGKPIEAWPPYSFFRGYIDGDTKKAHEDFYHWYREQLGKYHNIEKSDGGMYKGSLYRLIESETQKPFDQVDEEAVSKAIHKRVEQRFALLDSIRTNGYKEGGETIKGVRRGGFVYLLGGHHRAAILRALGFKELPNVFVFPHKILYSLYTKIR